MFIFDFDPTPIGPRTDDHIGNNGQFDAAVLIPLEVTRRTEPSVNSIDAPPKLRIVADDEYVDCRESQDSTNPSSDELKVAFAQATGWEIEFRGADDDLNCQIEIVDMSAAWPARKPTAHRGKCDQLATAISKLLRERTETDIS